MMGCSISPILFVTAFNLCLRSDAGGASYVLNRSPSPAMKSYVDDVAICTRTVVSGRQLLASFCTDVERLGMKLKPSKCRSLSIQCGRPVKRQFFSIHDEPLPSVLEKPTKFLGRFFDTGHASCRSAELHKELHMMLSQIDRSPLSGSRKLRCWHFVGLPPLPMEAVDLRHRLLQR